MLPSFGKNCRQAVASKCKTTTRTCTHVATWSHPRAPYSSFAIRKNARKYEAYTISLWNLHTVDADLQSKSEDSKRKLEVVSTTDSKCAKDSDASEVRLTEIIDVICFYTLRLGSDEN
jgi:hypothetical protein